jgi:hypothetical protein
VRRLLASALGCLVVAACGNVVPGNQYRIDVVPADKPLIVPISTERAAWMWLVGPGDPAVLLTLPSALAGGIELIDPADCKFQDADQLQPTSFTIRLVGPRMPFDDYELQLDPGATVTGAPTMPLTGNCSG